MLHLVNRPDFMMDHYSHDGSSSMIMGMKSDYVGVPTVGRHLLMASNFSPIDDVFSSNSAIQTIFNSTTEALFESWSF